MDGLIKITDSSYTVFGRKEAYWETINVPDYAFDRNPETFYDGNTGGYCGVEFNVPQNIKAIRYMPREKYEGRMSGTRFQVSEDGINYTTVFNIVDNGKYGEFVNIYTDDLKQESRELLSSCRYFRFFNDNEGGFSNVAEIELYADKLNGETPQEDYEIISEEINQDVTDIISRVKVRAENSCVMFIAEYSDNVPVQVKMYDVPEGENAAASRGFRNTVRK